MDFTFWLIFALITPFLWACNNVFDRALMSRMVKNEYSLTIAACMFRLPVFFLFWFLSGWHIPKSPLLMFGLLAGFLNVIPIVFYFKALQKTETSAVVLLYDATNPLFVFLMASVFLAERLSFFDGIGFFLLLSAGILSSFRFGERLHFDKRILWILLAAFLWAFPDTLLKYLVEPYQSVISLLAWSFLGGFFGGLLLLFIPGFRRHCGKKDFYFSKTSWMFMAVGTIIAFVASFTFLKALSFGQVSLTVVMTNIQPLFVFLLEIALAKISGLFEKTDTSLRSLIPKGIAFLLIILGVWFLQY